MEKIDPAEYQKRLDRLTEILTGIVQHAGSPSLAGRCPYKNRLDECTAAFGCRNQRPARQAGGRPACASDDKLDYRSAWETAD